MFIALDLETTGLSPDKDRIIEIAAILVNKKGEIQKQFQTLINPETPLPDLIKHLTGLTDEDLKTAPTIDAVRDELIEFIKTAPILGHSVQFDIDFLTANNIPATGTVLDTFHLAQTLLLNEPSYSLEILSEKFDLIHESKHRAMDDTLVAIELYKLLAQKIEKIPFETAEKIRKILEKSPFGWKEVFLEHLTKEEKGAAPLATRPSDTNLRRGASPHLQTEVEAALINSISAIFESPRATVEDLAIAATNFTEKSGEKCLLVTPEPQLLPRDVRLVHLQPPARYLCDARFQEFLKKEHFDHNEARLLIKIILWLSQGGTGEKTDLSIGDDEYPTWEQISALPHLHEDCSSPNCSYKKALKDALFAPVLVVSQHLYIENLTHHGALIPERPYILIDSPELIDETALKALTKHFTIHQFEPLARNLKEDLASRFQIFFGLLGMFLDKYADKNAFQKQIILEPTHYQTTEGQQILNTLSNLSEQIDSLPSSPNQRFLKKDLEILKKAFANNQNVLTWVMLSYEGYPVIRTCPAQISTLLKQELWDKTKGALIFLSNYGSLENNFSFLKKQLNLPADLPEVILTSEKQTSIDLIKHPEIPDPRQPKNLTETIEILKKAEKTPTFILVNAISAIDNLHHQLANHFEGQEILILSQGISGGMGKIGQRFAKANEPVFLIGTDRLFQYVLKNTPTAALRLDVLYIHRLPFMPPSHPVHQRLCKKLSNSWYDYSLPQAILKLKKFLHLTLTRTNIQTIHILDPRLDQYDGKFLKSIKNICQNA